MDVETVHSRKKRLQKAIDRSMNGLRLDKNGELSSLERKKIKTTVASTYQRSLIKEMSTPTTKTYDWWFTVIDKKVDGISYQRNGLGKNRYFIIDQEGPEQTISNDYSNGSTVGSQRVRELEINSHEISSIISGSKALFANVLKITVSEKEDAKI